MKIKLDFFIECCIMYLWIEAIPQQPFFNKEYIMKKIKIYDLDGTVIDSTHRYQVKNNKIDLDYWVENDKPDKIQQDKLLPLAKKMMQDINNPEIYVIAATARACKKNDANYKFLRDNGLFPQKFVHRQGRDDMRGGAALKIKAIKPLLNLKPFKDCSIYIYEDNKTYLKDLATAFSATHTVTSIFVQSEQGH